MTLLTPTEVKLVPAPIVIVPPVPRTPLLSEIAPLACVDKTPKAAPKVDVPFKVNNPVPIFIAPPLTVPALSVMLPAVKLQAVLLAAKSMDCPCEDAVLLPVNVIFPDMLTVPLAAAAQIIFDAPVEVGAFPRIDAAFRFAVPFKVIVCALIVALAVNVNALVMVRVLPVEMDSPLAAVGDARVRALIVALVTSIVTVCALAIVALSPGPTPLDR